MTPAAPLTISPEEAAKRYLAMRTFQPHDAVRFADLYQESVSLDEHDEFCAILLDDAFGEGEV